MRDDEAADSAAPATPTARQSLPWPAVFAAVAVALLVAGLYLSSSSKNPPGFYRDEASVGLNAALVAENGRDEYGARFPLFFQSLSDYRSPAFVYALAAVDLVTGPGKAVARGLGSFFGLATVVIIAFLAWRLSRRFVVGISVGALAGLVPWSFEVTRVAFEWVTTPTAFALVLLWAFEGSRRSRWPVWLAVVTGLTLALLTFSYQSGRLYGPLLACALALLVTRSRLPGLGLTWLVYLVTAVVPIAAFQIRHPQALTARFDATTFIRDDMGAWEVLRTFVANYGRNLDLWTWTVGGDSNVRHHVQGVGSLLLVLTLLSLAGLAIVVWTQRGDRFWWFFGAALVLVPVPASLTVDHFHAPRNAVLPVCLCILAVPAVDQLARWASVSTGAKWAVASAALLVVAQVVWFQATYWRHGDERGEAFEAGVEDVVKTAFLSSRDGRVYVVADDKRARTQLEWNALLLGRHDAVVRTDSRLSRVPPGAVLVARDASCNQCRLVLRRGAYAAYALPG